MRKNGNHIKFIVVTICTWITLQHGAFGLSFEETFEPVVDMAGTLGSINGQNGWILEGGPANVQSNVAHTGSQAMEIQNGRVSQELSNDGTAVWIHFQARCMSAPTTNPNVTSESTSVAFFVNTNLNVVAYSNTVPIELSAHIQTNVWTRFDVYCDYDDLYWDLSMDGINIAAGLPLYSTNQQVGAMVIGNDTASSVYIDQIAVNSTEQASEVPDSDNDGIPDWWEQKNFNNVTNVVAGDLSGNTGLTYQQTYIAGVNPTAFDPFISSPIPAGNGLSWTPVPGRLYSVYWAPSLTNEFTWLEDIPYPQSEFSDPTHVGDPAGFYQLKVQVQ